MIRSRKARWSAGMVLGVATLVTPLLALSNPASAASGETAGFFALPNSVNPTTDVITGSYSSSHMQIEVAVAPRERDRAQYSVLAALYTKGSPQYHKWLTDGEFDTRFAPPPATVQAIDRIPASTGLKVQPSSSPFLVTATGTSSAGVQRLPDHAEHLQGPAAARPTSPTPRRCGCLRAVRRDAGRDRPEQHRTPGHVGQAGDYSPPEEHQAPSRGGEAESKRRRRAARRPTPPRRSCSTHVNNGTGFPYGYGGGPGCSGLTPSQTNSIYGAPNVGPRARARASPGLFELSAYQQSDIDTWAHTFYGPRLHPAAGRTSTSTAARCARSARRATPACRNTTATPVTSRSTPTSRCS